MKLGKYSQTLETKTSSKIGIITRYYFLQSKFKFKELTSSVISLPHQPNIDSEKAQIHKNVLTHKLLGTVFYQESESIELDSWNFNWAPRPQSMTTEFKGCLWII